MWGQSPLRIILFLGTSVIFLYAGFGRVSAEDLRAIVGGMGILYLVSAGFLIVVWGWLSMPDDPEVPKILLRGTIGILSLLCARFLPQSDQKELDRLPEVLDPRSQRSGFSKRTYARSNVTSEGRPYIGSR